MHEIIYNIYIGDYHFETCIDEDGLEYLLAVAKNKAKGRPVRLEKDKVPIEEIHKMIQDKIADNRRIWEEAKRTKNPVEYVERYWLMKEVEKDKELLQSL